MDSSNNATGPILKISKYTPEYIEREYSDDSEYSERLRIMRLESGNKGIRQT